MAEPMSTPEQAGYIPDDTFAFRLIQLRRSLGLKQEEAAARCGINVKTWASWEANPTVRPRGLDTIVEQIHNGLGVDRTWLMWGLRTGRFRTLLASLFTPAPNVGLMAI